jgi:hypothetical protein
VTASCATECRWRRKNSRAVGGAGGGAGSGDAAWHQCCCTWAAKVAAGPPGPALMFARHDVDSEKGGASAPFPTLPAVKRTDS